MSTSKERLASLETASADYVGKAIYVAKGDLLAGSAASSPTVLTVAGTAGYVLSVDSTTTTGLKWIAPPAGSPGGTTTSETTLAGSAVSAGTAGEYARGDHTHGTPQITNYLEETPTDGETTKAPTSNWAFDHAAAATGVHGAGTSTLATTANITTHAALTSVHSLNTASTASSGSFALTTTYAAHTTDTAAHLGGAGTVASSAAVTALITTHASSILSAATHGYVAFVCNTVTVSSSVMTDITGLVASAGTVNSKYIFRANISNSCSLTAGVQYSFGFTGSNATVEGGIEGKILAGSSGACSMTAFATKSSVVFNRVAATGNIFLTGVVATAGTVGNFSIQHCSGSATGTITARSNSYLEWMRIA